MRALVRRKLGQCVQCLRLAVAGAVLAWIAAAVVLSFWTVSGWILAAVAVAFTALALAHLAAAAARGGLGAAWGMLLALYKLGCGCDKNPVGYAIDGGYATKEECEETGIPGAFRDATKQASDFCARWYECTDPDCPQLQWESNKTTADCKCAQAANGKWRAICDFIRKTDCCCRPIL
jgi:hypothetical protein